MKKTLLLLALALPAFAQYEDFCTFTSSPNLCNAMNSKLNSGSTTAGMLRDLDVVRTSGTVLTIGTKCSSQTPCNIRLGGVVYSLVASATATLSGSGTGTAYVYLSTGGQLTVGHNLTVACSAACTAASGVTSFPNDAVPLWTWTATSGSWDSSGGSDKRAFIGRENIVAGTNVTVAYSGNQTIISASGGGGGGTPGGSTGQIQYNNSGSFAGQSFSIGGSYQRAVEGVSGTVSYTSVNAAATTQEVTILATVPYKFRFDHIQLCETTQFAGNAGTLTVSAGRTGATNAELIPPFALKQSSSDANCWYDRVPPPSTPNASGSYAIVLNFTSGSGNLSTLTAGLLTWEVVGYAIP